MVKLCEFSDCEKSWHIICNSDDNRESNHILDIGLRSSKYFL